MKHEKPNEGPAHEAKESKRLEAREIKTGKELSTKKGYPRRGKGKRSAQGEAIRHMMGDMESPAEERSAGEEMD